ncbi:MAG: laccase domain-containing protein [Actinomycetota bacterium]
MIERLLPAGPDHVVRIRCSERNDGDFHVECDPGELSTRRQALLGGEWTWLAQVHEATVVDVDRPGTGAGSAADASVTSAPGAVLAVQTADCAPIVIVGVGRVGVAHAGWRGLVAGVIPATVDAVRGDGDEPLRAMLGPVIRPANYEFGEEELARVTAVAGATARSTTADGRPALDMAAAVRAILRDVGVAEIDDLGIDTADERWFSHRVRRDPQRQCTAARLEVLER